MGGIAPVREGTGSDIYHEFCRVDHSQGGVVLGFPCRKAGPVASPF